MDYDLLLRGGRIVDGSGLPSYLADIAIKDGKIVELGRLRGSAAKIIDVHGLVVAPGFIDHHTHMDGQIQWDPYATSEPQHGITSIVMGNCGLALAPVKPGDEDALVKSFVRVEAIPRYVLEQGVRWGWRSYGDYLDRLEGRLGVNVAGLVGHIAVRQYVLGEESTERRATADEIQRMKQLVQEAMEGGAIGFSTNRNEPPYARGWQTSAEPVSRRRRIVPPMRRPWRAERWCDPAKRGTTQYRQRLCILRSRGSTHSASNRLADCQVHLLASEPVERTARRCGGYFSEWTPSLRGFQYGSYCPALYPYEHPGL